MKHLLLASLLFSLSALAQEEIFQGELYQAVEDYQSEDKAKEAIHLIDGKSQKIYRLQFKDDKIPAELKELKAGAKYKVKGKKASSSAVDYLSSEEVAALETVTYPTTTLKGTRKVLGVRVNFADAPAVCTDTSAATLLFDAANSQSSRKYFQTVSRNMLDITGDIATVTISSTIAGATCDYNGWANLANQVLAANGVVLSNYNHRMYMLPSTVPCSWSGLGNVSGANTWVKSCNGYIMSHELGHNFGLAHASFGTSEYGDSSDTMGNSYRQFNSAHRHQLGWVANEKIQTVSNLGTYRISTLNEDPALQSLPQVIRIARPATSEFIYLSYRSAVGAFDTSLGTTYLNKLNIHRYRGSGYSKTFFLAAPDVGGSYDLAEGDYTINVISKDASSIEFSLSTNENCIENAPTLTLPAEFVVKAGANIASSLSLKNNHSLACNNQIFDLSITPHASISAALNPNMLDLAYGAFGSANFSLGVLASAASGSYTLPVKAINRDNPLILASGSLKVRVDATAPSVPLNVAVSLRKNAVTVTYSASTDNVAMGNYIILRNGIVIGQSAGTSYVDSGVPSGTHSYQVKAVDSAGNESAASAAAMITVGSSGTGGKGRR